LKIAYTGSHFPLGIQREITLYWQNKGCSVDIVKLKSRDAWDSREMLEGYDIIICSGEAYREETIHYLSGSLKMLSRHGIGTDEIRKDIATELGIAVCNAAGTLSSCVAECTLSLILNVLHGYHMADTDTRDGLWGTHTLFGPELFGKTVGLIGFGGIAQKLARYLSPFECKILAADPFLNSEIADQLHVRSAGIKEICKCADIISLHVPLTDETRGMVNMDFLRSMKGTAILINTSRGGVTCEADLITALNTGIIAGAGLDVFEKEPIDKDNPLLHMRNVMVLPHIASHTYDSQLAAGIMACRNAAAFIEGMEPESLLNPEYRKYLR